MIDTHIHLDSLAFQNDLDLVLNDAKLSQVTHFLIPGASIETLPHAVNIATHNSEVYYAVGIHPYDIYEILQEDSQNKTSYFKKEILDIMHKNIQNKKCKAIGECGLDYYRLDQNAEIEITQQIQCFQLQIELALQYNLPLILHVRDSKDNYEASKKVVEILRAYKQQNKNLRGVFHCYNACELLLEFSDTFYYGIGGIVTFKNAKELTTVLEKIPHNRILLETDAPYLAPVPHRGKRNESKFLPHIVEKISEILHINKQDLDILTTQNTQELFCFEE